VNALQLLRERGQAHRAKPRLLRAQASFRGKPAYPVYVAAGADGRPGEYVLAPSLPVRQPGLGSDGSRTDFEVFVSAAGSHFSAVSLGRTSEHGDARAAAAFSVGQYRALHFAASSPRSTAVAGAAAWHYRVELPSAVLLEWKFAHAGWLWVAGIHGVHGDDEATLRHRAHELFDSWTWIEPQLLPGTAA
jgi:hypothetical protein